jgi:hypothetical protein
MRGRGSIYERKVRNLTIRDRDDFKCLVCGKVLEDWASSRIPVYTLKQRGVPPKR